MSKQQPRLLKGGFTGRIYVVTRYKDLGRGLVEALEKYDITEEFMALATQVTQGRDRTTEAELLARAEKAEADNALYIGMIGGLADELEAALQARDLATAWGEEKQRQCIEALRRAVSDG